MKCPKCGYENPDDDQRCGSCGSVLKSANSLRPGKKARTSKMAVLSLVLGILSLPFFLLAGIPAIVIAILSIVRIAVSDGRLKGIAISLVGMFLSILLMCVFCVLWCLDAPPISNDYTIADFRSAPAEWAPSFEILKSLIDEDWKLPGTPAVGLTKEDVTMIEHLSDVIENRTASQIAESLSQHAAQIEQAWARAEKARDIIHRLNEFPEIADLTETGIPSRRLRWVNLIRLTELYQVYALLHKEPDKIHTVITELIELDSVLRKLSSNVRPLIEKLICLRCIEENMVTANGIVNDPIVTRESVELLAEHFTVLTGEQLSLRNGVLSEYSLLREVVSDVCSESAVAEAGLLKRNSMLRLYRNFYDDWIDAMDGRANGSKERLSVWPEVYPFAEPSISFGSRYPVPLLYRCYNPLIIRLGFMYGERVMRVPTTGIKDDLFQIVLNKKLGKEFSLKARAYSDEYIVDVENKKIFSPGPDGKPDTKDDISLPINPDVLGWGNEEKR